MDIVAELTNPVVLAGVVAVIIKLLKVKDWGVATQAVEGKRAQLVVLALSLGYVVWVNYTGKTLTEANLEAMTRQLAAIVALNVFFYEYVIKNAIALWNWAKKKLGR